jgi:hypothetical protein
VGKLSNGLASRRASVLFPRVRMEIVRGAPPGRPLLTPPSDLLQKHLKLQTFGVPSPDHAKQGHCAKRLLTGCAGACDGDHVRPAMHAPAPPRMHVCPAMLACPPRLSPLASPSMADRAGRPCGPEGGGNRSRSRSRSRPPRRSVSPDSDVFSGITTLVTSEDPPRHAAPPPPPSHGPAGAATFPAEEVLGVPGDTGSIPDMHTCFSHTPAADPCCVPLP